jgi:molybdenum cofactor sulfurtransferase
MRSTYEIECIRNQALKYFGFDPELTDLIFTSNTTSAIKLVAETLRESQGGFWYGYHADCHTSLVGVRELAREHRCFADDTNVDSWLHCERERGRTGSCLFAYPAQSNMNGRRLPLRWTTNIKEQKSEKEMFTLVDAASFAATSPLCFDSPDAVPDFTVLSFSKVFGFPDLGALVVRKDVSGVFDRRKYFGGGTVDMVVCVQEQWHAKKTRRLYERLEDGTLPIHSILALKEAIKTHDDLFESLLSTKLHAESLAHRLRHELAALIHGNGAPVCTIYDNRTVDSAKLHEYGPIVAFNLRDSKGQWMSHAEVEKLAAIKHIHIRTGGVCNPGGIATCLNLAPWEMLENFSAGFRCGSDNDIRNGKPTGIIRVSLGAMSTHADVTKFVSFVQEFFVDKNTVGLRLDSPLDMVELSHASRYVESLTVYPIKSCAGWSIPPETDWDVHSTGLAWDREWCLINQNTGAVLSQKNHYRMALLRPQLDFEAQVLRVTDATSNLHISIPLSKNPVNFIDGAEKDRDVTVCDDSIRARQYISAAISEFFTNAVGIPCTLARFTASAGTTSRHMKTHLQRAGIKSGSIPQSLLLSNESPILTISRSSLNHLNETIKAKSGKVARATVFRANIVVAEHDSVATPSAHPWAEDNWQSMRIGGQAGPSFDFLGGCRRCQMLCIDQETGVKDQEPFVTLAKTRRRNGKVMFGIHTALRSHGLCTTKTIRVGDAVETWV